MLTYQTLRYIFHHGTRKNSRIRVKKRRLPDSTLWVDTDGGVKEPLPPLMLGNQSVNINRLSDRRPHVVEPMLAALRGGRDAKSLLPSAWTLDSVLGPNITDKETVVNLALMTLDAYFLEPGVDWEDVGLGFNSSLDFGWEDNGLRGHVYADETNSTVVIGIKGTTRAVYDGEGTTTNDKDNDNLFFSCCCAQQGPYRAWRPVCDCATSAYTCNNTCLVHELQEENRYYRAARYLYSNVTQVFPNSNVWLTGHSLGGAVCSLLGLTYGLPVVAFESPPEALAASRLGLPAPPQSLPGLHQTRSDTGVYHFGHTADPVFMGTCTGANSFCTWSGYAMQTQCHTGNVCEYDTVKDFGWTQGVWRHDIKGVINNVLRVYDTLPGCQVETECRDCFNWKFFESNSSQSTTTSSSTSTSIKTKTRTETCKTPGWWGCLDKDTSTTTTTTSTTSSTSTTTTSTCKTPGWFGCKDKPEPTTTTTTSSTVPTVSATQTPASGHAVVTHPITSSAP